MTKIEELKIIEQHRKYREQAKERYWNSKKWVKFTKSPIYQVYLEWEAEETRKLQESIVNQWAKWTESLEKEN